MATQYTRTISIGKERDDFLKANPEFSFAGIARGALDKVIEEHKRK